MTIKEIRLSIGFTQQAFADYLGFSLRTVQRWEDESRKCNDAVKRLIVYKLKHEGLLKSMPVEENTADSKDY